MCLFDREDAWVWNQTEIVFFELNLFSPDINNWKPILPITCFQFEESKLGETRERQIRGLGTDIALVSSMVFLAQFVLSSCMGSIMHACGSTSVVVAAALLSFCGALTAFKVTYLGL